MKRLEHLAAPLLSNRDGRQCTRVHLRPQIISGDKAFSPWRWAGRSACVGARTRSRTATWPRAPRGRFVARFAAVRVRPAKSRGERWLLCEESLTDGERKYYFSNCPPTIALRPLVTLARGRRAVELQYRDLKSELGFDHFEGRSYPGWTHHAVLAAITYTFLQLERRRRTNPLPTFPEIRNVVRELIAALFFAERPQWSNLVLSFQRNPPMRI